MRKAIALLMLLGLAGCELALPWADGQSAPHTGLTAAQGAISGGAITVTPITPGKTTPLTGAPVVAQTANPEKPKAETPPPAKPGAAPAQLAPSVPPVAPKSDSQLACEAKGGSWASAGGGQARTCVFRTRDAGKSCRKQSDCEGLCLARSRSCAPVRPLFGCNDILQADGRQVTLCID
ncbi:hypothetical protein SAMN04488103_10668 [Gemmobacter aquatilis]|uniref:Uncharacterized protein n=1 Tax=Gemmobacter aquatilis TaxID=933059 RepID=A0A1H8HX54_9RHOB|nr:hypothetical protein [Gemmobacter aquatilis]SEN60799.1 hypothetical protein SAMN04488103_10668 [Gemmobacter aquatilis]